MMSRKLGPALVLAFLFAIVLSTTAFAHGRTQLFRIT